MSKQVWWVAARGRKIGTHRVLEACKACVVAVVGLALVVDYCEELVVMQCPRAGYPRARRQAEDQTEEPHHVGPDSRSWRFEWKTVLHYGRCSGGDVDELGEQRDRLIARIGRQFLVAFHDEGRDNGRGKAVLQRFGLGMEKQI